MDDPTPLGARRPRFPWIRNNILGLVAIFIAFGGAAFVAQAAGDHGRADAAKKKKVKPGPPDRRVPRASRVCRSERRDECDHADGAAIGPFEQRRQCDALLQCRRARYRRRFRSDQRKRY